MCKLYNIKYYILSVLNAKHENVIRCPVLLAGGDVMKFIFPEMFPVLNDNQNDNLTITISAQNAFP